MLNKGLTQQFSKNIVFLSRYKFRNICIAFSSGFKLSSYRKRKKKKIIILQPEEIFNSMKEIDTDYKCYIHKRLFLNIQKCFLEVARSTKYPGIPSLNHPNPLEQIISL